LNITSGSKTSSIGPGYSRPAPASVHEAEHCVPGEVVGPVYIRQTTPSAKAAIKVENPSLAP
jgi:hypothetical protein